MRREFSHRSLDGAPRARRRLLYVTLLIVVLVAGDVLSGGALRGAMRSFGGTISGAGSALSSTLGESGLLHTRRTLERENAALRLELDTYRGKALGYEAVRAENDALRALVSLAEREAGVAAPVISSFASSPYGTFLIGAGAAQSVSTGDLVLGEEGIVLGRVTDVHERTSTVVALFASGERTGALIGAVPVVVEGRGGGNAEALAPRSLAIAVGAPVIAPAFGQRTIGVVGRVESDPALAEQRVLISLPVPLASVRYVYVARN